MACILNFNRVFLNCGLQFFVARIGGFYGSAVHFSEELTYYYDDVLVFRRTAKEVAMISVVSN